MIYTNKCIENSYSYTYPRSVQVNGYKRGWDGEVVDKGVKLQHEPELVRSSNELKQSLFREAVVKHPGSMKRRDAHPNEEVDHEENVESQVDLLGRVLEPRNTRLHIVTAIM